MLRCQRDNFGLPPHAHYLNCAYMAPLSHAVEAAGIAALQRQRVPVELPPSEYFEGPDRLGSVRRSGECGRSTPCGIASVGIVRDGDRDKKFACFGRTEYRGDRRHARTAPGNSSPITTARPTGTKQQYITLPGADPAQIGFTPDGSTLVVTDRATNALLELPVAGGEPTRHPSSGATPYGFDFTRDGTLVVTEAFGGEVGAAAASSYARRRRSRSARASATRAARSAGPP